MRRLRTALRRPARRSCSLTLRHVAFVRALNRTARIGASWPRLALTLRRAPHPRTGDRFAIALAITPRIAFATTLATTRRRTSVERFRVATTPPRGTSTHTIERREAIERSHATLDRRLVRTERLVERIVTAGVRRHDRFVRVESPAAFRPVVQTLARPTPPASARIAPAHAPARAPTAPSRIDARAALRAAAQAPISGDELRRVTDHVIGELDRRVLSYRERTARH